MLKKFLEMVEDWLFVKWIGFIMLVDWRKKGLKSNGKNEY